jgi:hypothetical protein
MNLAVTYGDRLKKDTAHDRVGHTVTALRPVQMRGRVAEMTGTVAPHTQRIRARGLAEPGVHASGMIRQLSI